MTHPLFLFHHSPIVFLVISTLKNASTYDRHRKYLRWLLKVLSLALASTFIF